MYETVQTLQRILDFNFAYPTDFEEKKPIEALDLPELQLVVLLVISTKLLFPLDDVRRYPETLGEPATQIMNWSEWLDAQRRFENHPQADDKLGQELAIQLNDQDALQMDSNDMDQYMDWYERSWLDKPKALNPVADMFPTSRTQPDSVPESEMVVETAATDPEEALKSMLSTVMGGLKPAPVSTTQDASNIRPGSWYRRYRWESQLPETAHMFYSLAAELASVSLSTLLRAVSNTESRITAWLEDKRRADYVEQWNSEGDSEGDAEDEDEDESDALGEQLRDLEVGETSG